MILDHQHCSNSPYQHATLIVNMLSYLFTKAFSSMFALLQDQNDDKLHLSSKAKPMNVTEDGW